MKAGDRVSIEINGVSHHCDVIASESKSVLMLVNEEGECVATIQQFWRKTDPMLGQEPRSVETIKHEERTAGTLKTCEAPDCDSVYPVRKADLARGWGKTCCKSCAAKLRAANLREAKKNAAK